MMKRKISAWANDKSNKKDSPRLPPQLSLNVGSSDSLTVPDVVVEFLDGFRRSLTLTHQQTGQSLLSTVCAMVGVIDYSSYFGLRFIDNSGVVRWLEGGERVSRQLKDLPEPLLFFKILLYPPNPSQMLNNEVALHQLYLQVKYDLNNRYLRTTQGTLCKLTAYAIQVEKNYYQVPSTSELERVLDAMRTPLKVGPQQLAYIRSLLAKSLNTSPQELKEAFLQLASTTETYGVEPVRVKDQRDNGLCIGFNHRGIVVYKSSSKLEHLDWKPIRSVNQSGRNVIVKMCQEGKLVRIGFKCESKKEAEAILQNALIYYNYIKSLEQRELWMHKDSVVQESAPVMCQARNLETEQLYSARLPSPIVSAQSRVAPGACYSSTNIARQSASAHKSPTQCRIASPFMRRSPLMIPQIIHTHALDDELVADNGPLLLRGRSASLSTTQDEAASLSNSSSISMGQKLDASLTDYNLLALPNRGSRASIDGGSSTLSTNNLLSTSDYLYRAQSAIDLNN